MDRLDDGPSRLTYSFGLSTINSKYVAHAVDDGVFIQDLDNPENSVWHSEGVVSRSKTRLLLQLSFIHANWLAIACGSQTFIRNISSWIPEYKIPGNGRTVTALAWSRHHPNLLAIGTVDGSISIWSLSRRKKQLRLFKDGLPCRTISFSPHNADLLAVSHGETVLIWSLGQRHRPIISLISTHGTVTALAWNPVDPGSLLATTTCGDVVLWQLSLGDLAMRDTSSDNDDTGVLGELDDIGQTANSATGHHIQSEVAHATWTREDSILALLPDDRGFAFLQINPKTYTTKNVATIALNDSIRALDLWSPYGRLIATTYSPGRVQSLELPNSLAEHMLVASGEIDLNTLSALDKTTANAASDSSPRELTPLNRVFSNMQPISILQKREVESVRQGMDDRHIGDVDESMDHHVDTTRKAVARTIPSHSTVTQGMMSSLELPTVTMDDDSPMPFLSPSIPARKSPVTPGMEETLHIPLLPESSLNSFAGTPEHDSDSDDETFAPGMSGSGTLMPGGINVPLPKMCGALFAPGGQLVVFLRPKQHLTLSQPEQIRDEEPEQPVGHVRMSKLFPAFGNLNALNSTIPRSAYLSPGDSDRPASKVAFNISSQPKRPPRQLVTLPIRVDSIPLEETHTVDCRVYDLMTLLQTDRKVGGECRIFCGDDESGADVCRYNARITSEAGFADAADIWRLLAMILEDNIPLQTIHRASATESVLIIARQASVSSDIIIKLGEQKPSSRLRWADHPFGSAWLVQKVLYWAEQQADIHMLAYASAMLCQSDEKTPETATVVEQALFTKLPSFSEDFSLEVEHWPPSHDNFQSIPVLQRTSSSSNAIEESPMKARQSSVVSSRNASSPSTPFLDSGSSTPPFIFPGFSRQGSRLSASGSASPEHNRSSFSAAAKYYAQSITDKISSYGSSPPTKKLGMSPGMNEFSNSLPTGSWGKSVSFASAVSTTKDSQLSRSYTVGEEGYDSDKTIDESSLPQTPRSNQGEVTIKVKGAGYFTDERYGGAKSSLLPSALVSKAAIWRRQYAEQLRVWGFWMQAAELEKVTRLPTGMPEDKSSHEGPMPVQTPGQRRATCTICLSIVRGLQQVCPSCLHTTHLACLAEYMQMLGKERFACPAGCDCDCTALAPGLAGLANPDLTANVPTMRLQVEV